MSLLVNTRYISADEAIQRGVAGVVSDAAREDIIITRDNEPVAVVVRHERFLGLEGKLEDLRDLTLTVSRALTDKRDMVSFDDALTAYGLTEADLESADDLD